MTVLGEYIYTSFEFRLQTGGIVSEIQKQNGAAMVKAIEQFLRLELRDHGRGPAAETETVHIGEHVGERVRSRSSWEEHILSRCDECDRFLTAG